MVKNLAEQQPRQDNFTCAPLFGASALGIKEGTDGTSLLVNFASFQVWEFPAE
jgi:hypothetical protein